MRKLSIIFFAILILTSGESIAQAYKPSYENLTPVSPSAFQFLKYTEMPVSEYTGVPNISIPLYDINVDELTIPITLSYHAAGIRVSQEASWVGLGWDLTFGSVVQTVYDGDDYGIDPITGNPYTRLLPDYHNSPIPSEFPRRYNWPFLQDGPLWSNPFPIYSPQAANSFKICTDNFIPVNGDFASQYTSLLNDRWMDSEPDVFKANFFGHSISFHRQFNPERIVVVDKKGYAVSRINDTWKIITPNGDEFYFEQKSAVTTQTQTIDFYSNTGSAWEPSSNIWMLTKIITKNKQQIIFNYTVTAIVDDYTNYSERWEKATLNASYSTQALGHFIGFASGNHPAASNLMKSYSRSKQSYLYLSSIVFPKGQVTFNTSFRNDMAGGKKLDNIQITGNQLIKSYQFNYDYFIGVTGNGFSDPTLNHSYSNIRLKLLSIDDNSGATHLFTYNSTQLPWKNSFAQDQWGFYNGQTSNTSLIPNPSQFNLGQLGNNGDNHSANLPYTKAGILEKIKYPTGGEVSFEYELNEFDNYWVPDFNSSSNTISKGYGLRIKSITHSASDNVQSLKTRYTYTGGKAILPAAIFRQFHLNKIDILDNFNATARLAIFDYTIDAVSSSGFYSSSLFGSVNGVGYDKVIKEEINLSGISKGRTETNFYNNPDIFIHSAIAACQINATLPAIKNFNFYDNGSVQSVFYYDNQNNLLKKIENSYANLIYSIYYGSRIFGYTNLVYRYEDHLFVEYTTKQQNLIGYYPIFDFETFLQSSVTTDYSNGNALVSNKIYGYDSYNRLHAVEKYTSDGGSEVEEYTYPDYNPVQQGIVNTMWERNRLLDVLFYEKKKWLGFNGGPIYKYTKEYKQIGDKILEDKVSIEERYHPYDHKPTEIFYDQYDASNGNLLQYTTKGTTNSYIWDYNNEYVIAEIKNAPVTSTAYTSFEAAGQGNWTFSGTPVTDNTSPTGKKAYSLSSGSISKSSLGSSTTYYVSYWSKNGQQTVSGSSLVTTGRTLNGWTLYQHKVVNPSGGNITVSGSGTIDELRLFPDKAFMTTMTYEPLIGMTSKNDPNNRINYYEYDASNRLMLVRDQDKNIIKKICYNYAGQAENCFMATSYSNVYMSQVFTRNDCPSGYTGSQVTYIVQAGTFTSFISQADANAQAQAAINANGQAYANANGMCTPGGGGCNPSNCSDEDKKCINDVCETGVKVYTSSVYIPEKDYWVCTYHYEWSDHSVSPDYEEKSESDCIPAPKSYSKVASEKSKKITNHLK